MATVGELKSEENSGLGFMEEVSLYVGIHEVNTSV